MKIEAIKTREGGYIVLLPSRIVRPAADRAEVERIVESRFYPHYRPEMIDWRQN